jgi:hypothetical protein
VTSPAEARLFRYQDCKNGSPAVAQGLVDLLLRLHAVTDTLAETVTRYRQRTQVIFLAVNRVLSGWLAAPVWLPVHCGRCSAEMQITDMQRGMGQHSEGNGALQACMNPLSNLTNAAQRLK